MVGLRWVGCWALLVLSCGRTANTDGNAASGGSPSAMAGSGSTVGGSGDAAGATGSGGALGAAGAPVTEAGAAGAPLCPVTPVSGQWFARGPDPYGFEFVSDGTHLSGSGCLGALPWEADASACSPLALRADRGRSVDFVWTMKGLVLGYPVKMQLTVSPDRTSMAGTMWGSASGAIEEEGRDIVLVRYPADQPLPPATLCSQGVPSGACFLGPLRADRIAQPRVVELGGGNLLLLWINKRGVGDRIAGARFDATTGAWKKPEFLDDGTAAIGSVSLTATPDGQAMLMYRQGEAIVTRSYERDANIWSEPQILDASRDSPDFFSVWAAASDAAGNAIAVMVHGGLTSDAHELWFSRRSSTGAWSAPAQFYTSDAPLLRPAVAVGKDGTAIVTWQELQVRVASNVYSFESEAWGEPLTVTSQPNIDNGSVAFDAAGAPVASFHCNDCPSSDAEQRSTLANGVWGVPQPAAADEETSGATYSVALAGGDLEVTRSQPRPGESALPLLQRPRCEGY